VPEVSRISRLKLALAKSYVFVFSWFFVAVLCFRCLGGETILSPTEDQNFEMYLLPNLMSSNEAMQEKWEARSVPLSKKLASLKEIERELFLARLDRTPLQDGIATKDFLLGLDLVNTKLSTKYPNYSYQPFGAETEPFFVTAEEYFESLPATSAIIQASERTYMKRFEVYGMASIAIGLGISAFVTVFGRSLTRPIISVVIGELFSFLSGLPAFLSRIRSSFEREKVRLILRAGRGESGV
jgi:hypothetical protein